MSPGQCSGLELEEYNKLNGILRLLFPCTVHIQSVHPLNSHLHYLRLLTLSNGLQLVLKSSPKPSTALLRRERHLLETEARALALLGQSANPCIPQPYHYDPQGALLGSPFLVRQYVTGTTLQDMEPQLTCENRKDIDRHLGFLVNMVGQHVGPAFGCLGRVASGLGIRSWREAFLELFEGVLRDAEDIFIHLPYAEIRHEVTRLAPALEEVTVPRLVVVDLGQPSEVLLNPGLKQLAGIVDLSTALWGDVLMAEAFEDLSPAVLDGFGSQIGKTKLEQDRLLMYAYPLLLVEKTGLTDALGMPATGPSIESPSNTIGIETMWRRSKPGGD